MAGVGRRQGNGPGVAFGLLSVCCEGQIADKKIIEGAIGGCGAK